MTEGCRGEGGYIIKYHNLYLLHDMHIHNNFLWNHLISLLL